MNTPDTLSIRTRCTGKDCQLCRWDSWTTDDRRHDHHTGTVIRQLSHQYAAFGDYDNSCAVERANVRYLQTKNPDTETERGSYGYHRAWLPDTKENRELLQQLDSYPAFDDELVTIITDEIEDEYLERDGVDVFDNMPADLKNLLDDLDLLQFDREMYEAAKETSNTYFQVESGGIGYIDFKRIAPAYQAALLKSNPALARLLDQAARRTDAAAAWTLTYYENAADMLEHISTAPRPLTAEEARALLIYAAELEATR